MVVLSAEQEVDEEDRHSGTSDNHDAVAEEQKSEHVVDFAEPHVVHDEVKLNKDGAKRENTNKGHRGERAQISGAWRDLAWNLVHANGRLNGLKRKWSVL